MRIIFSRKGFDSGAGGCASPIIDGEPISLPIPLCRPTPVCYRDLAGGIGEIVKALTRGRVDLDSPCHLDPDLRADTLPRKPGWRGALGQESTAQAHLDNNRVQVGDLFLFWGLFRPAVMLDSMRFSGPPEHRIFGWLQAGDIVRVGRDPAEALIRHPWLSDHPHVRPGWAKNNTVYVGSAKLALPGIDTGRPGWGVLPRGYRLTMEAPARITEWLVPDWLNPKRGGVGMTYHSAAERWGADGSLRAVSRGQEFVADIGERSDALEWVRKVLQDC